MGNERARDLHEQPSAFGNNEDAFLVPNETLTLHCGHDEVLVVVSGSSLAVRTLEQTVVPLRVEQPILVEASALELVIHIGRHDEIVLPLESRQKIAVRVIRRSPLPRGNYMVPNICLIWKCSTILNHPRDIFYVRRGKTEGKAKFVIFREPGQACTIRTPDTVSNCPLPLQRGSPS